MRVLYVPFFSSLRLEGCSIFNAMKVLMRGLVEANPDLYLYYLIPSNDSIDVSGARYLDHPRILQIPVRAMRAQEDDLVYIPEAIADLFNMVPLGNLWVGTNS